MLLVVLWVLPWAFWGPVTPMGVLGANTGAVGVTMGSIFVLLCVAVGVWEDQCRCSAL